MPRIWFIGPGIFGSLIRPGISFSTAELKGKRSRSQAFSSDERKALEELMRVGASAGQS